MKRQRGKKKSNSKERVFGCDLLSHLEVTGQEVPQVLKSCTEFIEEHGIVDGIYRLSGISSNIQKLRQEFDTEKTADLSKEVYFQDIHCVSSLCKAYFRELPNPLLMYQLYDKFADAVNTQLEQDRLLKIRNVLEDLPIAHYRTLEYLMRHLLRMASHSSETNMHARNLAIVWAPNLLRSKEIESSGFNGTAAFMEVRVQSIVVEFILNHVEQLFGCQNLTSHSGLTADDRRQSLPSSSSAPSLAHEECGSRILASQIPHVLHMGDGPPAIRPYHSIIELPEHRRKGSLKVKKWRSIFNLGRSGTDSKRKAGRNEEKELKSGTRNLRPAKSMDSLSSEPFTSDGCCRGLDDHISHRAAIGRRDSFGSVRLSSPACDAPAFSSLGPEVLLDQGVQDEPAPVLRAGLDSPRSGKAARQRAEKRAAMHISGPFSVSLPQHVSSLLGRASEQGPGSAGGKEEPRDMGRGEEEEKGEEEEDEGPRELVAGGVQEEEQTRENHDAPQELLINSEITLELQDTFSFLDIQDTLEVGDGESDDPGDLGMPLRTPEEMEPYEYYGTCESVRTGLLEMSIESELMDLDLDSRELRVYDVQVQYEEFSVEPPVDEIWNQEDVYEPPSDPVGSHPSCLIDVPLGEDRGGPPQGHEPCTMHLQAPSPDDSVEAGNVGCPTAIGFAQQEDGGEGSAEAGNANCLTVVGFSQQEDGGEGSADAGNVGCSTAGGFSKQVTLGEGSVEAGNASCSTMGCATKQEAHGAGSMDAGNSGCSTAEGFTEQMEEPVPTPEHPELAQWLAPTPMRLEPSPGRILQAKALPVVPPKPHYAKLPPALKGKRRHEPLEPQAAELRPPPSPAEDAPRPSPASRWIAWRSSGSMSFDEAVALARKRKHAPYRRLQTFSRGDSLPTPGSPPPPSVTRDRLSLPHFPEQLRLPASEPHVDCLIRCRSLVLEGEEAE